MGWEDRKELRGKRQIESVLLVGTGIRRGRCLPGIAGVIGVGHV